MKYKETAGGVLFQPEDDFDAGKIFDCGQCFRWNRQPDGSFIGVAGGRAAQVIQKPEGVYITGTREDFESYWRDYFDLEVSYAERRRAVSIDGYMTECCRRGEGIRILAQDRWETLCSFIISQCNNIPRIKKIVETFSDLYGERTELFGREYRAFPTAERTASLSEGDLAPLRSGYRAPYILAAARQVAEGKLDLEALAKTDYPTAKRRLMELPGIGEKVANCVILFSLRMPSAFPVDVWIKKALREHYPQGLDTSVFGRNAGLAQQYMFYSERYLGQ